MYYIFFQISKWKEKKENMCLRKRQSVFQITNAHTHSGSFSHCKWISCFYLWNLFSVIYILLKFVFFQEHYEHCFRLLNKLESLLAFFLFFNPHPRICLLILERKRERERERERHQLVASRTFPDGRSNVQAGVCPDRESDPRPLMYQTMLPPRTHQATGCDVKTKRDRNSLFKI